MITYPARVKRYARAPLRSKGELLCKPVIILGNALSRGRRVVTPYLTGKQRFVNSPVPVTPSLTETLKNSSSHRLWQVREA